MFVFLDGNLAEVKRLLIPLDVPTYSEQRGRLGGWGLSEKGEDVRVVFKGRELL